MSDINSLKTLQLIETQSQAGLYSKSEDRKDLCYLWRVNMHLGFALSF